MSQLAHYGNVYKTEQSLIEIREDRYKLCVKDRIKYIMNKDSYYYDYVWAELYDGTKFLINKKLKIKYICTSLKLLKWYVNYFKFNKSTYYKTIINDDLKLKFLLGSNIELYGKSVYSVLNVEGIKWIDKNNYSSIIYAFSYSAEFAN